MSRLIGYAKEVQVVLAMNAPPHVRSNDRGRRNAFVKRTLRNIWPDRAGHSGLMFAARITLPHFSVSSAMSLAKSAGESTSTSPPRSASRALILGSARPALISLLSLSTISVGVFLGAPMPNHWLAS